MKHFRLFLLLLALLPFSGSALEEITFQAEYFPPYVMGLKSSSPGFAVELLRALFPKEKFKLNFVSRSWERSILDIPRRRHQGIIGVAKADAPDLVYPAVMLCDYRPAVYVKRGQEKLYRDPLKSAGWKFAAQNNVFYGDALDARLKQCRAKNLLHSETGWNAGEKHFRALLKGDVQAVVEESVYADWILHRLGKQAQNLVCVQKQEPIAELYIAFSNHDGNSWRWRDWYSREFEKFRKTPAYRILQEKYLLVPKRSSVPVRKVAPKASNRSGKSR